MTYYSTKTYGHNIGLSAVFRQPNADRPVICCMDTVYNLNLLLVVRELDNKNWAVDFGGLKPEGMA